MLTGVPLVPVAYRSPILIDAFFARPTALCAPQRVERSDQIEGTEVTCGPRRLKGLVMATRGHAEHPRQRIGKLSVRNIQQHVRYFCRFERWSVANRALLVPAPGNPGAWLAGSCGSSPALPARLELQVTAL